MNRLIACAVLGFGLASGVVACSDDDDVTPGNAAGTTTGGSSSAGKNSGGSAQAGTSTAGTGGATAGSAGKTSGGTATGGISAAGSSVGGQAVGGDDAVGGEDAIGGAGGAGGDGAGGAPPVEEPQLATAHWLGSFCDAISLEELGCASSPEWVLCYDAYSHFISAGSNADGACTDDDDDYTKLVATLAAFDSLAAACPDPEPSQFSCALDGTPSANDPECDRAYDAASAAYHACVPN